ncbi:MAG: GNAT family N-acetyltransferase [Candidatus Woesearchaeota archaeon]
MLKDNELTLRKVLDEDASSIAKLADNKKIADNLTHTFPNPYSLDDAKNFIKSIKGSEYDFVIDVNGEVAGMIGGKPKDKYDNRICATLGYWLGEPFWGKGYATRALKLYSDYLFDNFKEIHRLEASVFEYNPASGRVLEKVGFTKEHTRKEALIKNDKIISEHIYTKFRS